MAAFTLPSVEKLLDTVLGFRPTEADMELITKAEAITGKKRSDLLRACFHGAIGAVVDKFDAQRQTAKSEFERTLGVLQDSPNASVPLLPRAVNYTKPPKRKAS